MNNKPMLSVERELLEELRNVCGDPDLAAEANALLDNPVFESQYGGMNQQQAQAVSDGVEEILHGKPAAQQRGEPVAWLNVATGHVTTSAVVVMDWDDEKEQVQSLYAEQSAPVAVVMPERREPSPSNPHLSDSDHEYNSALDDVALLNGVKP